MGRDKAFLTYHQIPQCYHLADLLLQPKDPICGRVLISCNELQKPTITQEYDAMSDLPEYRNSGPIASLLTAFHLYPDNDLLAIGCDYPFLTHDAITEFLDTIRGDSLAGAFYNRKGFYEPLLAWYTAEAGRLLKTYYNHGEKSLQRFLIKLDTQKYIPAQDEIMTSIDTPDAFERARFILQNDYQSHEHNRSDIYPKHPKSEC